MDESVEDPQQHGTQDGEEAQDASTMVWIMVDRSCREAAFEAVAQHLRADGIDTQIVTLSDVIGSVARDAFAGGAERLLRGLRVAFKGRGLEEDFLGAVRRARPDVLAVTNPRYARALGLLESLSGISTLQVGILPDYNLSPDWINSSLQAFVVPTQEHRERLVANGLLGERVLVAAPAIEAGFVAEIDRDQAREKLGFDDEQVVLVRADGFSAAVVEKIVFQATLVDGPVRFIFHHNGDGACAAALRRAADQYGLPAAMFGKVSDLQRFVVASDLVMAAPADPYVAETLSQGRPILFVGGEDGGAAQAEFLSESGAARYVLDVLRLGSEVERMLDAKTLGDATEAAAAIGARDGGEQTAAALGVALENADAWLHEPVSNTEKNGAKKSDADSGSKPQKTAPTGPFETIGGGQSASDHATENSTDTPGAEAEPDTTSPTASDESTPARKRNFSGLSVAEAKDQLAELILMEREYERRLGEAKKQQKRWENRLELANEWKENDLAEEAEQMLSGFVADVHALQRDLDDVRNQKSKLKRAAEGALDSNTSRSPAGSSSGPRALLGDGSAEERDPREVEERFRKMELDRDLDDLKNKLDRDFGD